jgi:SAM-dependent methyltransferase
MKDVVGHAQTDYQNHQAPEKLLVQFKMTHWLDGRKHEGDGFQYSPIGEMPVEMYFREIAEMPEVELKALQLCKGHILDIGAGAGCHALALQDMGQQITALDLSPLSVELMKKRGVQNVILDDFFLVDNCTFDTLLLLMNGIGICGTKTGLCRFFAKADSILRPGRQIVFDSTDIAYLFKETPTTDPYYGEVGIQYEYKDQKTDWNDWLFIDRHTLKKIAAEEGWQLAIEAENEKHQYTGRCWRR